MSTLSATGRRLTGHAVVFNSESVDLGGFTERIAPEALDRTMSEKPDVRALWGHDANAVLARASSGTLTYDRDRTGLRVVIDAPDTQLGRDTAELVRRGDVNGMSFGFTVLVDDWAVDKGDRVVRTVRDLVLREVSIVSFPAYPAAGVSLNQLSPIGTIRNDATDGGSYSRWNQKPTSPEELNANALRVKLAKLISTGTATCKVCHRAKAVAVRCDVIMCRGCLTAGDERRAKQFHATTGYEHLSPEMRLLHMRQRLIELL